VVSSFASIGPVCCHPGVVHLSDGMLRSVLADPRHANRNVEFFLFDEIETTSIALNRKVIQFLTVRHALSDKIVRNLLFFASVNNGIVKIECERI